MMPDDYDAACIRLANLADFEERQRESCSSDLCKKIQDKRQEIIANIADVLLSVLGPPLCPLCDPSLLQTMPRTRLRNCAGHSYHLMTAYGQSLISRGSGTAHGTSSTSEPISTGPENASATSAPSSAPTRSGFGTTSTTQIDPHTAPSATLPPIKRRQVAQWNTAAFGTTPPGSTEP